MKKLIFYSAIALFAASCASQKYSRTDNITDDVYFSPSLVENQVVNEEEEPEQDGFHYDTESNTPNPNASYYRYQAGGANTTYQTNTPDSTQSLNYSNPGYSNITNNYYGNNYNQGAFGYSGWGMTPGFGCQPGFGMLYSPYSGWGWGISYSNSPYGFYSPYGSCYNPWGSPFGYNPYYGYSPYSAYSPWYGYTPGYGYYNPYGTNPYPYNTGSSVSLYNNQPRISGSTILPSTLYGSGTGRGRAATTTDPVNPVFRPENRDMPNTNPPVLRGTDGGDQGVTPQDGNITPPRTNPAIQPERPEARPNPNPTPTPQRPEARPTPQRQRPEARPNPNPTPAPQRPQARPTPQPQRPEARPAPRNPNINPSPSPSPSPSRPSGNGGSTPQRRR